MKWSETKINHLRTNSNLCKKWGPEMKIFVKKMKFPNFIRDHFYDVLGYQRCQKTQFQIEFSFRKLSKTLKNNEKQN